MFSSKLKTHFYAKKILKAGNQVYIESGASAKAGVLIDAEKLGDSSGIKELCEALPVFRKDVQIVVCGTEFEIPKTLEYEVLDPSEVSVKGEFRNENIKKFAEENFDFLICNLSGSNLTGFLLAAICRSPLKIGSHPDPYGIYDVMIKTEDQGVFQKETLKYLEILKKK